MEVILLEKIRNLGALGEQVKVKPGFARNFLIPQGKAVYANEANIAKFEKRRAELEKLEKDKMNQALERQKAFNALLPITIEAKASEEGKLFGSIGTREIVEALEQQNMTLEKREVQLPEGAIRQAGDYDIQIELESDINATIKLHVVAKS